MYSQSRKWVAPRVIKEDRDKRMNNARRKICPNSIAWEPNMDLELHKKKYAELQEVRWQHKARRHTAEAAERVRLGLSPTPPAVKPAFGGKMFENNYSSVLSQKTIFTPNFEQGREEQTAAGWLKKEVAGWPSKMEMKYEGDDRIATDKIHRRFLGAPRAEGNETVNWQQRSIISQYELEDFYYPKPTDDDIFMGKHWIRDLQFSDAEGVEILGKDLMDALNE
jgi:hypothetical protein